MPRRSISGQAAHDFLVSEFQTIGPFVQEAYADIRPYTKTRRQAFRQAVEVAAVRFAVSKRSLYNMIAPPAQRRGDEARRFLQLNLLEVYEFASRIRGERFETIVRTIADEFHLSRSAAREFWDDFHDLPAAVVEMHVPIARNRALAGR